MYRLPWTFEREHAFAGLLTLAVLTVSAVTILLSNGGSTRLAADRGEVKGAFSERQTLHVALAADGRIWLSPRPDGTLAAGAYELRVRDNAADDSIAITGPGISEATGIAGQGLAIWRVHLDPGTYVVRSRGGVEKLVVAEPGA